MCLQISSVLGKLEGKTSSDEILYFPARLSGILGRWQKPSWQLWETWIAARMPTAIEMLIPTLFIRSSAFSRLHGGAHKYATHFSDGIYGLEAEYMVIIPRRPLHTTHYPPSTTTLLHSCAPLTWLIPVVATFAFHFSPIKCQGSRRFSFAFLGFSCASMATPALLKNPICVSPAAVGSSQSTFIVLLLLGWLLSKKASPPVVDVFVSVPPL